MCASYCSSLACPFYSSVLSLSAFMQKVSLMFSSRALSAAIALPFSAPIIYSYFILRFRIRLSLCSASAKAISILLSLFSNNFSDTDCLTISSWVTGCGMKGSLVGGVGGKGLLC